MFKWIAKYLKIDNCLTVDDTRTVGTVIHETVVIVGVRLRRRHVDLLVDALPGLQLVPRRRRLPPLQLAGRPPPPPAAGARRRTQAADEDGHDRDHEDEDADGEDDG